MIDDRSNRSEILCWGSLYQIQVILEWKARRWWVEGWGRQTIYDRSNRSEILCWGLLYQIQVILEWKARRQWVEGRCREMIDDRSNRSEILCWGLLYQIQAILKQKARRWWMMVVEDEELSLKILKILPIQTLSFFFTTLELEAPPGTPNSLSLVLYTQITSWLNGLCLTFFWPPIVIPSPTSSSVLSQTCTLSDDFPHLLFVDFPHLLYCTSINRS